MSDEMDGSGPSSDGTGPRLPPPAFPPGSRKLHVKPQEAETPSGSMDDAFISPDEPMPERSDFPEDAFISPDAPIERVTRETATAFEDDEAFDADDIVVTGMGHDAHLDPEELAMAGDPHVMEVSAVVSKLAADLKQKGEAGLRASPDMGKFESTLRGYCVGYLAGRRAEEEPPPLMEASIE